MFPRWKVPTGIVKAFVLSVESGLFDHTGVFHYRNRCFYSKRADFNLKILFAFFMSLLRPSLSVPLTLFCQVLAEEEQTLVFTIPIFEPLPSQYYVRGVSDRWLGSEVVCALSFKHLILPEKHPPHTELLDLQPLPITALKCEDYELLYR